MVAGALGKPLNKKTATFCIGGGKYASANIMEFWSLISSITINKMGCKGKYHVYPPENMEEFFILLHTESEHLLLKPLSNDLQICKTDLCHQLLIY